MKPLLIFPIADPHNGSIYGLHPNYIKQGNEWVTVDEAGGWHYKNNPHYYLNSKQLRIWRHFESGVDNLSVFRKRYDCDLIIIVEGDAIDGDHHGTHELVTANESEQMLSHVEMMKWVMDKMEFQAGLDKLIYIEGTESHVRDNEEVISQFLPAEKFGRFSCIPFLELEVQGNLLWMYHHGVAAGYSYSQGAGLYNYIKGIYIDRRMNQKRPPNLVMTAHTHKREHQTYRHNGHELHGLILPPLQEKTRFTRRLPRAIVHETRTGISPVLIKDGKIIVLEPHLLEIELGDVLKW